MNDNQAIIEYIRKLLDDVKISEEIPEELLKIEGIKEIDESLRSLRKAIQSIGNGDLSERISGKGYTIGILKNLQATMRNLTWQTKAISNGDFSQRVNFLGEFSEAFNDMVKKLKSAILEVGEAKDLFEMLFETIPDATMIISMEKGIILDCNRACEALTGYEENQLNGRPVNEIHFFKDSKQEDIFFNSAREENQSNNVLIELELQDGAQVYGLFSSDVVTIENEKYLLSVIKDITEMKQLEQSLKESEELHRLLADNANDVIWTMDLTGKFTYVSPSVEKLRGYTVEEVLLQSPEELLCPSSRIHLEKGLEDAIYLVQNNKPFKTFRGDLEQPCKDGTTVWTDLTVSGIYDRENHFVGMLGVSRDITDRRQLNEEIRRLSETDRLTQLNNRLKLDEVLNLEIERLSRSESVCSVILFDLDHFKRVNDTFGHLVGDIVLKEIAQILKEEIRQIDTVGRWGGEEFMIIMPLADINGGQVLAEKIRTIISEKNFTGTGKLTASFGVAETRGNLKAVELVARADVALYESKKGGRNRVSCIGSEESKNSEV